MIFTIEAYKFLLGMDDSYRLKVNGEFSVQRDFNICSKIEDLIFCTFKEAEDWLKYHPIVNVEGKNVSTIPPAEIELFDKENMDFEIIVHREEPPKHLFTIEEINNVLLNGDDGKNNSLVIDLDGYPRLIQLENYESISSVEFAVIFETFCAGNQYVGSEISIQNNEHLYRACLEAWLLHLETGRSMCIDHTEGNRTIVQLIEDINKQIRKFRV